MLLHVNATKNASTKYTRSGKIKRKNHKKKWQNPLQTTTQTTAEVWPLTPTGPRTLWENGGQPARACPVVYVSPVEAERRPISGGAIEGTGMVLTAYLPSSFSKRKENFRRKGTEREGGADKEPKRLHFIRMK